MVSLDVSNNLGDVVILIFMAVVNSAMQPKDSPGKDVVWFPDITGLNVKRETIPVIITILILIFFILFFTLAYILWRCCISSEPAKKKEIASISTIENNVSQTSNYSTFQKDSNNASMHNKVGVVELIPEFDNSVQWLYSNHDLYERRPTQLFRSVSYARRASENSTDSRSFCYGQSKLYSCAVMSPVLNLDEFSLPQISEFSTQPCPLTCNNSLDDCCSRADSFNNFRTRSLPSCVRFKRHSAITPGDSVADLYDKVNFSKKRKNRMRNDEAAIIALSKSRSQLFDKDTDSLVDNEAVIVYDERTAL